MLRARVLPRWVPEALLGSLVSAVVLHGGAIAFVSDYLVLAALFCFGWYAARPAMAPLT